MATCKRCEGTGHEKEKPPRPRVTTCCGARALYRSIGGVRLVREAEEDGRKVFVLDVECEKCRRTFTEKTTRPK